MTEYATHYGFHPIYALDPAWDETNTLDECREHWHALGFRAELNVAATSYDAEADREAEQDRYGNYGPLPEPEEGRVRIGVWTNEDGETWVCDLAPVTEAARRLLAFVAETPPEPAH